MFQLLVCYLFIERDNCYLSSVLQSFAAQQTFLVRTIAITLTMLIIVMYCRFAGGINVTTLWAVVYIA